MSLRGRLGLIGITCAVVVMAMFAARSSPGSHTVDARDISGSYGLTRPPGVAPQRPRAWRMQLRLDPNLPQPGPEWLMREGRIAGAGHELVWMPESSCLQIHRGGDDPLLLGTIVLSQPPHDVTFARRGCRLAVTVDGDMLLEVLDPEGVIEPHDSVFPDGWTLDTPSNLGSTTLVIQDDGDLPVMDASDLPTGNRSKLDAVLGLGPANGAERLQVGMDASKDFIGRRDYALLCVRSALSYNLDRQRMATLKALSHAAKAVAALGSGHPDHRRLRLWLAWAEARNALRAAKPGDAALVRPAIDQLSVLVSAQQSPEGLGMLLALLPGLADAAVARPTVPRPLKDVLRERAEWLTTLNTVTKTALSLVRPHAGDGMDLQLQFIAHACGSLLGPAASDDPDAPRIRPTPANAPLWLITRWRAIAGDNPEIAALPPLPTSTTSRNALLPVIDLLMRSAALDPLSAVRLRATILDTTPSHRVATDARIAAALENTRPREAAIARVLIALRACNDISEPGAKIQAAKEARLIAERYLGKLSRPKSDSEDKSDYLIHHDPL
ncbi:MAG: hypothetical protein AAB263_16500, partial [Planctomycetota bacterium]